MQLRFAQHGVEYPAATDVRTFPAAMIQDRVVVAAGILERIGEDRHTTELTRLVDLVRQRENRDGSPRRVEVNGLERIPDDFPHQSAELAVEPGRAKIASGYRRLQLE